MDFLKNTKSALIVTTFLIASSSSSYAKTLATVNGVVIDEAKLIKSLGPISEAQTKALLSDDANRNAVLENVIDQEVLLQAAKAKKIDQTDEYKSAIDATEKQMLVNMLIQKSLAAKVTDPAVKAFYKKNVFRYSTEQVRAQHILVADLKTAEALLKEVQKSDTDFQKVAAEKSIDPSAKSNRGEIGYFTRDQMVAEFSQEAFAAKPGTIVGPVKTAYGYHLIKVIDHKTGKTLELPEVEQRVKNELQQERVRDFIAGLRKSSKITK